MNYRLIISYEITGEVFMQLLYMNQEAKQQRGVSSEKVVRFFASLIFGFIYVILTS